MKSMRLVIVAGAAALAAAGTSFAAEPPPPAAPAPVVQPAPIVPPAPDALPDAATLQRLARRAVWEATGVRMYVGPVILREKLADGSWLVDVILENGRPIRGRLYRHRRRYKIALDRRDLFIREQKIQIVK